MAEKQTNSPHDVEGDGEVPDARKGQPSATLDEATFRERWKARFYDPEFENVNRELDMVLDIAWEAYRANKRSPRRRRAGEGFAEPDYELPAEWLDARAALLRAEESQKDVRGPSRVLVVCGSDRSDQTCPGEMSKTYRLALHAKASLESEPGFEVDLLDLSLVTSEFGRVIHPCKGCVSTAMPLCHWPCSCYPNHNLGQVNDWMNEIYTRWVSAHGIFIVTPVYWYQAPSALKLMMDRLVCADGGNPDPTTTSLKDPKKAKKLELAGWHYPRHLAGRAFSVVVHGDADGVESLRRGLTDWLTDMGLVAADPPGGIGLYVGYYEPYATNHVALERETAVFTEIANASRALARTVRDVRAGKRTRSDEGLSEPRPK